MSRNDPDLRPMSWAMATVAVLRWLGRQIAGLLGALILFLAIILLGNWGASIEGAWGLSSSPPRSLGSSR